MLCFVTYIQTMSQTAIPQKPNQMVNDYADVLTSSEESKLEAKLRNIDNRTGIQIAAVTIQTLDGADHNDFALELGRKWGVGHKDNAGIVILISIEDRKWSIQAGYGLEKDLPDITCSDIGHDYLIPNLKQKAFYNAFDQTADKLLDKAGMMSWGERLDQRTVKAELEAKESARRKAAEEADRLARKKRNQENWDLFLTILGSLGLIGLPISIIWFFITWYRTWKKERNRRKELQTFCAKQYLDVHGTMVNINNYCTAFPHTIVQYPTWVQDIVANKYKSAKSIETKFENALNWLKVFTKSRVKSSEQDQYNKYYDVVSTTPTRLSELQSYVMIGLLDEYRVEESNKKTAIENYNIAVTSCENQCEKLIKQGYNLDKYQASVNQLVTEFKECVMNEGRLGNDFDNTVNDIVERIAQLQSVIADIPIIRKEVEYQLAKIQSLFPASHDKEIQMTRQLLQQKYQPDAWNVACDKWDSLFGEKYVEMQKALTTITTLNSMDNQRFSEAKEMLFVIQTYISQITTQKRIILALDNRLKDARKMVLSKRSDIDNIVPEVKKLASDSDVSNSTERTVNTLLTKVINFSNALTVVPEPDWIANEEIAISLYAQLEDVKKKMKNEISSAVSARNTAKDNNDDNDNSPPIINIGGGGSGSGSSWSGFGGGSFRGGGAGGDW